MEFRGEQGKSRLSAAAWGVLAGGVALSAISLGVIDVKPPKVDWFDGGESDPVPAGDIEYQGQTVETASESFMVKLGEGTATVAVEAKQNWDKPGGLFSGDFQNTNGTSFARDPEHKNEPAKFEVTMSYCADALVSVSETTDVQTNKVTETYALDLGDLFVCDSNLDITAGNNSRNFHQDDTSSDFHGNFVQVVGLAVEAIAAGAPCPEDEIERYSSEQYVEYAREQLADQYGVDMSHVQVEAGMPGETSTEDQNALRQSIENFRSAKHPETGEELEAFSIMYSGSGEAVEDSCYRPFGSRDMDSIDDAPQPEVG